MIQYDFSSVMALLANDPTTEFETGIFMVKIQDHKLKFIRKDNGYEFEGINLEDITAKYTIREKPESVNVTFNVTINSEVDAKKLIEDIERYTKVTY